VPMIKTRAPYEDELDHLSALCMRSKAVWGYGDAFMEACRGELTITLRDLRETHMQVAEEAQGIVGLVKVKVDGGDAELLMLFVDPVSIRTGVGKILFNWAVEIARSLGAQQMNIDSDPGAAGFYRKMGARYLDSTPSGSIPGRLLPRLLLDLAPKRQPPPTNVGGGHLE